MCSWLRAQCSPCAVPTDRLQGVVQDGRRRCRHASGRLHPEPVSVHAGRERAGYPLLHRPVSHGGQRGERPGDDLRKHKYAAAPHVFVFVFSHFYAGSTCLVNLFHLTRSCASSLIYPFRLGSPSMSSIRLHFGLPLLRYASTFSAIIRFPTYSSFPHYMAVPLQPTLLYFL